MQDQFIHTTGDVLRMLDTLVGGRDSAWWGEFFADRAPFSVRVLRQMNKTDGQGPYFGEDFLWALLATKEGAA